MEASSRPDEGRNAATTAGFGQGGERAQRSVRVWGDGGAGGRIPRQTPDVCTAPSKSYSTLRRSHHDPIQQIRAPRLTEVNMPRSQWVSNTPCVVPTTC